MIVTAELSLYPLHQDYYDVIEQYILELRAYEGLTVETNRTATHVMGEMDLVFQAIKDTTRQAWQNHQCILVAKFLHGVMSPEKLEF